MTELPVDAATESEDAVAHFDITPGPDLELENARLEEIEAAEKSAEALSETHEEEQE